MLQKLSAEPVTHSTYFKITLNALGFTPLCRLTLPNVDQTLHFWIAKLVAMNSSLEIMQPTIHLKRVLASVQLHLARCSSLGIQFHCFNIKHPQRDIKTKGLKTCWQKVVFCTQCIRHFPIQSSTAVNIKYLFLL